MKISAWIDYIMSMLYNPIIGNGVGPNSAEDAQLLSELCSDVRRMPATNSRKYWYLFLRDRKYVDVALYLFGRNGLEPQFHNSRYNMFGGGRQPSLRIETKHLDNNPQFNEFIKLISAQRKMNYKDLEVRVAAIREQMKSK